VRDVQFELAMSVVLVVLVMYLFLANVYAPPSFRVSRCRCR
jgi:multidrug efflux pump